MLLQPHSFEQIGDQHHLQRFLGQDQSYAFLTISHIANLGAREMVSNVNTTMHLTRLPSMGRQAHAFN